MTADLPDSFSPHQPVHPHPACADPERLLHECEIQRTRAGGPGGQHRNKVETAIRIVHNPTGLTALATERRSQEQNRSVAIQRLRLLLAIELRTVSGSDVYPSDLWTSRCRSGRIQCNDEHSDFPALLAEAMDAVDAKNYDVRVAAAALGCSTSQLVRFLAKQTDALKKVNDAREQRGLRRLKP
ncbi:MAG: peptide chain release factor-like protein [Planctomycetaceae bacterium]